MNTRRSFLATGLALPAAGLTTSSQSAKRPGPAKTPVLKRRVLGKTGLKVTEVGFSAEGVSDIAVVRQALDLGISFYDTAHAYEGGNNERTLGAALGNQRKNITLASRSYAKDVKGLESDLNQSLTELKTDCLDIWYLGNHDAPVSDELLAFRDAARKAGKFRFSGFSTHRPWATLEFVKKARFDVVMIPYNFATGTARDPFHMDGTKLDAALDEYAKAGIGVVGMKVMAGGYRGPRAPKDPLAEIHQRPNAFVAALRWALRTPRVQTTSVSMRDREQLEDDLHAMEAPYSEDDAKTLAAHLDRIRPLYCRMCYECDGKCPQGLPVADMLRYLMYADGYGRFDVGYGRFKTLPAEARAVRCRDCGECAVQCPNGVAVRQRLIQAQELFG
jgi:predicted aldo/keto reductase-like oxidoreductase